jgi:hypothetical protein
MTTTYLTNAMTRVCDMQEECVANSTAVPYPHYTQEDVPYWTNNFAEYTPGEYYGSENYQGIYTLDMRYIIGHITDGYQGQPQEHFWRDWPIIQQFFMVRPGLKSSAYTTELAELESGLTEILASPGLVRFQNSGIGADQVGGVLRLRLTFNVSITPKI